MDGLLAAVKTIQRDSQNSLEVAQRSHPHPHPHHSEDGETEQRAAQDSASPEYIIGALKSKPDRDQLFQILATLDPAKKDVVARMIDIRVPSPTTAQILQVLVSEIIPTHWDSLNVSSRGIKTNETKARAALLRCLSSVAGLSSLVTQLRTLTASSRSLQHAEGSGSHHVIRDILAVLSALLNPKDFVFRLYTDISSFYTYETQKQVACRELVSLVAASRVLSTAAEALLLIRESNDSSSICWVGEGAHYASWLGGNICHFASNVSLDNEAGWKSLALFTGRALSLGYTDQLVKDVYSGLLINAALLQQFDLILNHLRQAEQVAILEAIFRDVEKTYFSRELSGIEEEGVDTETVNGVATLCSTVIGNRPFLEAQVTEWLSKGQGGSIRTVGLRRALLATFAKRTDALRSLLTKSFENFGDKFYIKHTPVLIQNANTQVLLLAAGYLHQLDPAMVVEIGRSSIFLASISNRLAASSTRSRFLGMLVGMAISQLVEQPGKAMKFELEEMESDEATWFMNLIKVKDECGSLQSLKTSKPTPPKLTSQPKVSSRPSAPTRPRTDPSVKIVSIEEIDEEGEEDEHDDLIPYEKPDEDASDSEDDPTLIRRDKPVAPVYIRDLITYLRDTDNLERFDLAVSTAPSLIRRKTGFGTELIEHMEELALVTVGLQDQTKSPKFHEHRLQSMIGLIVAQPMKMGRWFSAMFFDGDISQAQRSAILTALGLGARELAGNGEEDARNLKLPALPDTSFPSKKLSAGLEALYLTDESPVASLTRQLSQASLQPLAANAADALSGPSALKVRTFSSRMEVEKKRQQRDAQRQKATVKDLHKVLSEGFFYPLKGHFEVMMVQFSSSTAPSHNPFLIPHLLTLFLQTLTLILSSMGPHTPFLPTLTQETLTLLLSLHGSPIASEPTVLAALLSLFLVIVDMNIASGTSGEERLVTEFAAQVIELREWVGQIFDRMPAGQGMKNQANVDPQEQVRTLAAGVMVKLGEVIERYQGRLMGINAGFKY